MGKELWSRGLITLKSTSRLDFPSIGEILQKFLDMLKRFSIMGTFMNRLDSETRAIVISCLIEGCSIRATVRMTGVAKKTVMRLWYRFGNPTSNKSSRPLRLE